jgi:nucleotide-binding universal stress UspA family protein
MTSAEKYTRMLVPLDGSELAEGVLPYARAFAGRLGLEMTLLHICTAQECELVEVHRDYIERVAEMTRRQTAQDRERLGIPSGGGVAGVRADVAIGHPAEEIIRYADENNFDLVVMATHGRSGIGRWALGSVAEKVLRASRVPILLVRAGIAGTPASEEWPGRTILVPLDSSPLAECVLPHVTTLAKQGGADLLDVVLLAVCEPMISPQFSPVAVATPEYVAADMTRCRQLAEGYLAAVEGRLRAGGLRVRSEILIGKAADAIIDYAGSIPSDLIAMATHGRSGLSRWVYGSVASKVLLGASRPVFLVRPQ